MNNNLEDFEKNDLMWDITLLIQQLHHHLENLYENQDNGDLSKVEDWCLNGSIRYIKQLNSQKIGFKKVKTLLIEEQDRRRSLGIWNSRNS